MAGYAFRRVLELYFVASVCVSVCVLCKRVQVGFKLWLVTYSVASFS